MRDNGLRKDLSAVKVPSLVQFNRLLDADVQAKITVKNKSRMIPTTNFHTPSNSKKGGVRNQRSSSSLSEEAANFSRANASGAAQLTTCSPLASCLLQSLATSAISRVIFLRFVRSQLMRVPFSKTHLLLVQPSAFLPCSAISA